MDIKSKIILIAGPTASGKSNFSIRLAKKINGEIINADSMQVYKQIKILTARPKVSEQKHIKHHLYGFHNVKRKFSTGHWLKLATKKIKEVQKKNKIPIIVGGTGLYFKSLTEGLVKIPNIPIKFRNQIRSLQNKLGQKKFYNKLVKLDPLIRYKINANDVQRSIRAFEVKKFTNLSIIKWFQNTKALFDKNNFIKIYINFSREDLINRITKRVDRMFKDGAIIEVKRFNKLGVKKDNSANKIIGIHEIGNYLAGEFDLNTTKEKINIKTRQYAKRQSTWARSQMSTWERIDPKELKSLIKKLNN